MAQCLILISSIVFEVNEIYKISPGDIPAGDTPWAPGDYPQERPTLYLVFSCCKRLILIETCLAMMFENTTALSVWIYLQK